MQQLDLGQFTGKHFISFLLGISAHLWHGLSFQKCLHIFLHSNILTQKTFLEARDAIYLINKTEKIENLYLPRDILR